MREGASWKSALAKSKCPICRWEVPRGLGGLQPLTHKQSEHKLRLSVIWRHSPCRQSARRRSRIITGEISTHIQGRGLWGTRQWSRQLRSIIWVRACLRKSRNPRHVRHLSAFSLSLSPPSPAYGKCGGRKSFSARWNCWHCKSNLRVCSAWRREWGQSKRACEIKLAPRTLHTKGLGVGFERDLFLLIYMAWEISSQNVILALFEQHIWSVHNNINIKKCWYLLNY